MAVKPKGRSSTGEEVLLGIELFASLRGCKPVKKAKIVEQKNGMFLLKLQPDVRVKDVLSLFNLKLPKPLILVNGSHARENKRLKNGDRLSIFPPIAGGRQ